MNPFLAPAALGLLGLLPVVLLLYFLKLKRREQAISSTYLWRKAIEDLRVNSPFQRLRRNLLLWLQLALLALMVFALARPAWNAKPRTGVRYICLLDTSASMAATDVRPNRLDAARRELLRLVGDMGRDDQMMLMTFDVKPKVLAPFTGVKSRLRAALQDVRPSGASTDFAKAIELVRAIAQDMSDAELYVASDGCFGQTLRETPNVKLRYIKVGERSDNVGITAIDARRSVEDWDQPQVFVRLENFGSAPKTVRVDLYLDGKLFDARTLEVSPGESAPAVFADPGLRKGAVRVVKSPKDDLADDDEAHLVLVEPRLVRALVVTEGNYFLELAVGRDAMVSPVYMTPDEFDGQLGSKDFRPADYDVIVLDRHSPDKLPPGAYVFLGAAPALEGFGYGDEATGPIVIDWDTMHPVNQYVSFANLFIEKTRKLLVPDGAHVLVESDAGPLVAWHDTPSHRVLVVGFDLFASRWPLRVSFPVFMANAVRYFGGVEQMGKGMHVRPGKAISFDAPPGVESVEVTYPDGSRSPFAVQSGRVTFGDTRAPGPYVFKTGDEQTRTFVVNLTDPRESDIAPVDEIAWGEVTVSGKGKALKENREFWYWPLLAAFSLLLLEWYIYNRRMYV